MVRPLFFGSAEVQPSIALNVDFMSIATPIAANLTASANSKWGIAKWGIDKWGAGSTFSQVWRSVNGVGYCASLRMSLNCNRMTCSFQAWDIIYEKGGLI